MSKFTRGGKQDRGLAPATRADASGVTLFRNEAGVVTGVSVDSMKMGVPERTYRASTGTLDVSHAECTLNFGQLKVASKTRLQSAVAVVMPLNALRSLVIEPAVVSRIEAAARGGSFPPFPRLDVGGDYQSLTYEAQFIRMIINEQLGYAVDFFQMPVELTFSANVQGVIRVTMSPSLFAAVAGWVGEAIRV